MKQIHKIRIKNTEKYWTGETVPNHRESEIEFKGVGKDYYELTWLYKAINSLKKYSPNKL